jgi:hypothetical protein
MLFENYDHKFIDDNDRLIFVQTTHAREYGERLHKKLLRHHWTPPVHFYHFNDGGHVAAARAHLLSRFFVRIDLAKFFDSINRGRVHRSLRRIGVKHGFAWEAACQSTVSKDGRGAPYSLPFGFVQSPVLASLALATSALGAALSKLNSGGLTLSVYMDDFILSGDEASELTAARDSLEAAAKASGFQFNPVKSVGPSATLEVFNLNLSQGHLALTATRFVAFAAALKVATAQQAHGVLGYVGTVNAFQRSLLAAGRPENQCNHCRQIICSNS